VELKVDLDVCLKNWEQFVMLQAERSRLAEKQGIEDEALQYKLKLKDVSSQNDSYKKKMWELQCNFVWIRSML